MKKTNKYASNKLIILSLIFSASIIILFNVISTNYIRTTSKAALNNVLGNTEKSSGSILPDVYYLYTDNDSGEELLTPEDFMLNYYRRNIKKFEYGNMYRYKSKRNCMFFIPVLSENIENSQFSDSSTMLIYVDASFVSDLVKNTTLVLLIASLVMAVILCVAGHSTAKVLDDKEQSLKSFFQNATHELKTPLMAIRGYAEGVEKGVVSQEKGYQTIVKETDRMSNLVGDILELSKVDSGVTTINPANNDIREIIYDALEIIEPVANQDNINISFNLPSPLMAECDEQMIFSSISNVLTNSIRYAKSAITIESIKLPGLITIKIEDDGGSLSDADAQHIFDRFYKGANGQMGIGMALAKEYIKLHNGDIKVIPAKNSTLFVISIPTTHHHSTNKIPQK